MIRATPAKASTLGAPNIPNKNSNSPTTPNSEPTRPAILDIPVEFSMSLKYQNINRRRYARQAFTGMTRRPSAIDHGNLMISSYKNLV
jgi:hypothetical protein